MQAADNYWRTQTADTTCTLHSFQVTLRFLDAGKHVIEEKPIGAGLAESAAAIARYRADPRALFLFAENYRFEQVFLEAQKLCGSLGAICKIDLVADLPMVRLGICRLNAFKCQLGQTCRGHG